MDGSIRELAIFLTATFAAALVAGVAGFAFALAALGVWLHILTPMQTATLVIGYGLIVQGMAVWTLRPALSWPRLWPFLAGGAIGVPIGVAVLDTVAPGTMRAGIGGFLVLYSLYALARPAIEPARNAGVVADTGVGLLNGLIGGMTGLAAIIVTVWCGMRGWPKDTRDLNRRCATARGERDRAPTR